MKLHARVGFSGPCLRHNEQAGEKPVHDSINDAGYGELLRHGPRGCASKLLDEVAYACAARYCKGYVVTLSLDQVFFKEPIHVGELVTFMAHVNYVGRTSLEVGIRVIAENLRTQEKRHTNSCYFTMVSVDENGTPRAAPPLQIETEAEKKLNEAAKMRKEMRKEIIERNEALHVGMPD